MDTDALVWLMSLGFYEANIVVYNRRVGFASGEETFVLLPFSVVKHFLVGIFEYYKNGLLKMSPMSFQTAISDCGCAYKLTESFK